MSVSVSMPQLGESVTEGTVTRWLKKEGERVEADEPLLEVSTDKVDTEIPSPAAGVVTSIKVQEDETVEVGVELATIDEGGTAGAAPAGAAAGPGPAAAAPPEAPAASYEEKPPPVPAPAPQPVPQAAQPQPTAPASSSGGGGEGAYVTPLVRKLAAEHGVDLGSLQGTGVGGRIRKQ